MGMVCKVCRHPKRAEIENARVSGATQQEIVGRFGVTKGGVDRHFAKCLPGAIAAASAAREVHYGTSALENMRAYSGLIHEAISEAREAGDRPGLLQALDRAIKLIDTQGKLFSLASEGDRELRITWEDPEDVSG